MTLTGEMVPSAFRRLASYVAPFEAGMNAKGGDPRLACIIDHNSQRIEEMKARYP